MQTYVFSEDRVGIHSAKNAEEKRRMKTYV